MLKVVVTGPESSGKSTLAQALAEHYHVPWVPEYARDYLGNLSRDYQEKDLLEIARGQVEREDEAAQQQPNLLVCDTSLVVIKVWSEYRYGHCHPWILEQIAQRAVDSYLLCKPDIPWEPDPLRENPADRHELFMVYQEALQDKPAEIIQGNYSQRLAQSINTINRLFP